MSKDWKDKWPPRPDVHHKEAGGGLRDISSGSGVPDRPPGAILPDRHVNLSLSVDEASGVPLYVQVKNQIRLAVERGDLPAGAQLPTVRDLAVELNINANTVARIYADLEREGYLKRRRGIGTFAVERDEAAEERLGWPQLLETLRQLRELGYSRRQIQELTAEALESLERGER